MVFQCQIMLRGSSWVTGVCVFAFVAGNPGRFQRVGQIAFRAGPPLHQMSDDRHRVQRQQMPSGHVPRQNNPAAIRNPAVRPQGD
ncbi:hypothetical protein HRbin18_00201 [bacterium HR18]|nr:hypothetical protein HRbin18_00201 [bacterium HR18]